MKITDMANKIWNSEIFEAIVDTTFVIAECLSETLIKTFNHAVSPPKEINYYKETYDYWNSLIPVDREYYFKHNEVLQKYGDRYYYDDKEQCARAIAKIAQMECRSFIDKYDKY